MKMKKSLLIFITIFYIFFIWHNYSQAAETNPTIINLDNHTVSKGYTASSLNQKFKIGIISYAFNQAVSLKIDDISDEIYPLPPNSKLISDIYLYDFSAAPHKLLNLSIAYNSFSAQYRKIYFWDKNYQTWRALPSKENGNKTVAAVSPLKSARIAVFEKTITSENELMGLLTAKSAIVMDANTGEVLFEKDSHTPRPIASLTKIMTAIIFLEHNPGWDKVVEFLPEDDTVPSKIYLDDNDTLKISDLFYSMLVKSANNAAKALPRLTNLDSQYFIWLMNLRAQEYGLGQTKFQEPTGLEPGNISTAYEYAVLTKNALKIPDIPRATTAATYSFQTIKNNNQIDLENSNKLFGSDLNITATKTGYTYEAGNCLMTSAKNLATGRELIAVVLNSKSGYLSSDVYTLLDYYLHK